MRSGVRSAGRCRMGPEPASKPTLELLGGASYVDVLYDQLDFLTNHAGTCTLTQGECPLCERMEEVGGILLSPFTIWEPEIPTRKRKIRRPAWR
jgi:hypothetical protein